MDTTIGALLGYPIYTFAVALAVAVAAGLTLSAILAHRRGVAPAAILDVALWCLPAALAGARLQYAAVHWPEFAPNPAVILNIWEGGLALPGAVTAGAIAALVALRLYRLPAAMSLDAVAPAVALGQLVGHAGCAAAGCAVGVAREPGSAGWWLLLPDSSGLVVPRFPSQFVEAAGEAALCLGLWLLWTRRPRPGTVAAAYLVGYGALRAVAEWWRGDSTPAGPLPFAVWWGVAAVLVGTVLLLRRRARGGRRYVPHPVPREPRPAGAG